MKDNFSFASPEMLQSSRQIRENNLTHLRGKKVGLKVVLRVATDELNEVEESIKELEKEIVTFDTLLEYHADMAEHQARLEEQKAKIVKASHE